MKNKDHQNLLLLKKYEQSENIKNRIKKINTEKISKSEEYQAYLKEEDKKYKKHFIFYICLGLSLLYILFLLMPLLMGKSLTDPQYNEGFATGTGGDQEAILDRGEERLRWFPEQRNINEELLYQLEDAYSGHPKEWEEYKAQFNINLKERGINVSMEEYLKGGALKYETVPAWDFKTQELSFEFNKGFIVNNK
tara:strand:- start:10023 stop:10604 length:582 start_codon:yes stop_codon:yes gene_type:complete